MGLSSHAQTLAEALDTTNLVWTTGGDAGWFTQTTNTHDGVDAVRSGILGSNQTCWIEATVVGPATVSFWTFTKWSFWDYPAFTWSFSLNGNSPNIIFRVGPTWTEQTYDLGEGTTVLHWTAARSGTLGESSFIGLDSFTVSPPRPLEITYHPADLTLYSGDWNSFSVTAIGTPPFEYQWRKDGTNIVGATNSWVQISEATTNDAGLYSVIVSSSQGFVISSNARLTVLPTTAPFFVYEPRDTTVYAGETTFFSAWMNGSPPFSYQWRKDGTNIPGATWSSLSLNRVTPGDAGSYSVVVSNSVGGIESSNAVLSVLATTAPVITRQPRSLEVAAGVTTWLSLVVTGAPDPYVSWRKVGEPPPVPPQNPWPPFPGLPNPGYWPSSPFITFPNVSNLNAGVYWATATNLAGAVESWPAMLTVLPAITNIGSWWQGAMELFVTNDLVFLAQGASGLAILSVSNVSAPALLGGYNTPGTASAVWVSDGLAYVADGSAGLQILNVSNPFAPALVGSYNTAGYAYDIIVRSNLAYVADGNSGLLIFDVSNPAALSVVGSYASNSLTMQKVSLAGNYALVVGSSLSGLLIVDITNPANPSEVGRLEGYFSDLAVREQNVFAVGGSGILVISITNPAQPVVLGTAGSFPGMFGLSAVQAMNDLLYVTGPVSSPGTLHVFDVRDLREPTPVGYYTNAGKAQALWVAGNRVYLSGTDSTLQILQTPFDTQPAPPAWLSLSQTPSLRLTAHGRRGSHYDVEYTDGLTGFPWLPLQTILQTNEHAVIELPPPLGTRFYRLRQWD